MARSTEAIQLTGTDAVGLDYAVQFPRRTFYLTYQGKLCQVRKDKHPMGMGFKYVRCSWSSEATTQSQVKRFNKLFSTDQFGYVELTNVNEVLHNHLIK